MGRENVPATARKQMFQSGELLTSYLNLRECHNPAYFSDSMENQQLWQWLVINWGSTASAVGLLVSIAGFSFAIRQILKTRGAVEAAETAAVETRSALSRNITIDDLTRASL